MVRPVSLNKWLLPALASIHTIERFPDLGQRLTWWIENVNRCSLTQKLIVNGRQAMPRSDTAPQKRGHSQVKAEQNHENSATYQDAMVYSPVQVLQAKKS
jgi:hypothetical protein